MKSRWREHSRPIIARVLAETAGQPEADVRRALSDAYPFGPKSHHPYKVWLSEIAIQQGRKPPLGTRTAPRKGAPAPDDPNQGNLFDGELPAVVIDVPGCACEERSQEQLDCADVCDACVSYFDLDRWHPTPTHRRSMLDPTGEYQGSGENGAELSEFGTYRYALWRSWNPGLPVAVFVMLNPSTADGTADDPTIRKCVGFAKRWKCGAIYVVNLFAYRATDPRKLRPLDRADRCGEYNGRHLRRALSRLCSPGVVSGPCVAAWGRQPAAVLGDEPARLKSLARQESVPLQCLGFAQDGNPRHPLMLAYATELQPYPPGAP